MGRSFLARIFVDKDIIDLLYLKLNQTFILAEQKVHEIGPDNKHSR